MRVKDTCRLAAELNEEYGDLAYSVAARAVATFTADGQEDRAIVWRALHAILGDIAARRFDPYAPIAIH
jgi:hypothetical protein